MLHIKRTCFALLSWTFISFFTIIKLQFNDYLLQIMFALFKYNDWFSEKYFQWLLLIPKSLSSYQRQKKKFTDLVFPMLTGYN